MSTSKSLVIYGAGGHAIGVANVAWAAGFEVHAFVDPAKSGESLHGIPVVGAVRELPDWRRHVYALGVGDNAIREKEHRKLAQEFPEMAFPTLVHPTAVISWKTTVGEGSVLMANAVAGTHSRLGRFCVMSIQSAMGHDCVMEDYASMAPSSVVAGDVEIGERAAVCMAAAVKQGVKSGRDAVLGAKSYLNRHLPAKTVAFGTPARDVRSREAGDPYLSK